MYAEEIMSMIDGPKLREQRQVIINLIRSGRDLDLFTDPEIEALEGLTVLLDEIADCCHDVYGKDCLFTDPEMERFDTNEVNRAAEEAEYNSIVETAGACHE